VSVINLNHNGHKKVLKSLN